VNILVANDSRNELENVAEGLVDFLNGKDQQVHQRQEMHQAYLFEAKDEHFRGIEDPLLAGAILAEMIRYRHIEGLVMDVSWFGQNDFAARMLRRARELGIDLEDLVLVSWTKHLGEPFVEDFRREFNLNPKMVLNSLRTPHGIVEQRLLRPLL
jgi:hypothetical protein